MIKTIFLDMDGVIADFDYLYSETYGMNCRDDPEESHWFEFVSNDGFYNLPTTKNADQLLDKVFSLDVNVEILSCIGTKKNKNQVRSQKIRWLNAHGLGHLLTNFTSTKILKSSYASTESLLIDDSEACIKPFKEKGGYGILHHSVKQTIQELNCLINKKIVFEVLNVY